jgi:hypothetical protein
VPVFGTSARYAEAVAKRKRSPTWAEVGYMNTRSMRTTFRALTFAIRWAACCAELGQEPESVDEFCEVMREARRTAFRDQQAFRQAFPTETTPLRMIEVTGLKVRFEELYGRLQDLSRVEAQMAPMAFTLGAATADL